MCHTAQLQVHTGPSYGSLYEEGAASHLFGERTNILFSDVWHVPKRSGLKSKVRRLDLKRRVTGMYESGAKRAVGTKLLSDGCFYSERSIVCDLYMFTGLNTVPLFASTGRPCTVKMSKA